MAEKFLRCIFVMYNLCNMCRVRATGRSGSVIMSNKWALVLAEVKTGTVRIESAFELIRLERRKAKIGEKIITNLDEIKCGRFGLTAREAIFAYLVACSESVNKDGPPGFKLSRKSAGKILAVSPSDIAIQCGFNASDADVLMSDRSVKQAIKEYRLQKLNMDGSPVEDLRNIALSRLASASSANVDSIVEYQSDRNAVRLQEDEVPEDNYYGYIPMAGGSMVRIKQMTELPDHVALAIKSFKIKNEGTKEFPILVPDIEFYDGVRAAELLLKYTGDIGNKSNSEDVAGAVRDIVGMIDTARRRNADKKPKELEEVNVIDTDFVESEVIDSEQEDWEDSTEVFSDQ